MYPAKGFKPGHISSPSRGKWWQTVVNAGHSLQARQQWANPEVPSRGAFGSVTPKVLPHPMNTKKIFYRVGGETPISQWGT